MIEFFKNLNELISRLTDPSGLPINIQIELTVNGDPIVLPPVATSTE